jgi:hypothetical protein
MGSGDKQALLALVAEDIEWIIPGEGWPLAGTHRGHTGLAATLRKASEEVEMTYPKPPEFSLPVVSLAGLAILKVFAWSDRKTNDKDALDLYRIIATYADAGNLDRLYDSESRLLEESGYDLELAGAALLGRDVRQIAGRSTLEGLRPLLTSMDFMNALAERIRVSRWPLRPEQLVRIRSLLSVFSDYIFRQ